MKNYNFFMFIKLLIIIIICSESTAKNKNGLTSPVGPYQLVFKQIYNCEMKQNSKLKLDAYLSHTGNSTLILGKSTLKVPFDDTLFLEMRLAFKDSFGQWKENHFVYKSPKACSTLKEIFGNAWTAFTIGSGFPSTNCPIRPGIYDAPGFDPSVLKDSNAPKVFLYGTYKFHLYFTKNNEVLGCEAYILEFKRP
ncbi:uncharacterized protein LOC126550058 [Aphis gossypii]|uniref:uncharacterized protein LOC126550058 n=2 Tax=Aphis gossypii TaxID=80765 RepID=UPI0021593B2A|nr:uncharacterized protein LOC114123709 isoform X1 [Aphis gossypii]XP_050056849.1 uncharacterized protein LOC126550058 [Aphis gossypii]